MYHLQCWEAAVNVASQHLPGQLRTVVAAVAHKLQEVDRRDLAAKLLKVGQGHDMVYKINIRSKGM